MKDPVIETNTSEAIDAIRQLSEKAIAPHYLPGEDGGALAVIIPEGHELQSLEEYESSPRRLEKSPVFVDTGSFIEYVNDYMDRRTKIFGTLDDGKIIARLDYSDGPNPEWNTHNATLAMKPHPDWKEWAEKAGKPMAQEEFARFIERFTHCVIEPDSATLIETIEKMEVTSGMQFESKINRVDGSVSFTYKDDQQLVGQLKVPTKFYLSMAPFEANKPQTVEVLLRYRVKEGTLTFSYDLPEFSKIKREAFLAVCEEVTKGTDLSVLR